MPFKYKAKEGSRRRKPFTKAEIESAVREIKSGTSIRKTAIKYGIDRSTLRRYSLSGEQKIKSLQEKGSQYKASQIFTQNEEKMLVNYLMICSKMHYGLTRKQAMEFAFDFAKANSKKIPQSWSVNNSAGKDWFRGFLARNQEISLRRPEATSLSRATSFNKKNVSDFFNNLRAVRERFQFEPQNIYNCDETGCSTVQECPKVIAGKKLKQVGQVTSADRGTLVTVCFAVNAIGGVIPPFFKFPRVRYQEVFVAEGPTGSDGDAYPSGWMTATCFVKFLKHFIKYSLASKDNRVLLVLDNHESHVSAAAINLAKDNGITLLTIPPHCSSRLQPLDVSIYASFKSRYNSAMNNWMLSNPGKTVTIYNIPGFIKSIMPQSFSLANILSGFRTTGIHPFNSDIFDEDDFLSSSVTDRVEEHNKSCFTEAELVFSVHDRENVPTSTTTSSSIVHENNAPSGAAASSNEEGVNTPASSSTVHGNNPQPSTSQCQLSEINSVDIIRPEMIRPYPKAGPRKSVRRGRQPGKTKILTQTPERNDNDFENQISTPSSSDKIEDKENKKLRRQQNNKSNSKKREDKVDTVKRKALQKDGNEKGSKSKKNTKKRRAKESSKKRVGKKRKIQKSESETSEEEDVHYDESSNDGDWEEGRDESWFCFVCGSDEIMDMRLCVSCHRYVHEICVGLTKNDVEKFICHDCTKM